MAATPHGHSVREAQREDAPSIHRLLHAAYESRSESEQPPHAVLRDTVDDVRTMIAQQRVLVAVDADGRIVGSIATRRVANLRRLAVPSEHAHSGLGRALLEAALDEARDAGFEVASLDVVDGHPWLPKFYEQHGFVVHALETRPDGSRWVTMRRTL